MLWFEREVVGALVTAPDHTIGSAVEAFVDGTLRDMPELFRAAVATESVVFGTYYRLRARGRSDDSDGVELLRQLDAWERSPVGPVRQYVRLMRSLVLFAEQELILDMAEKAT